MCPSQTLTRVSRMARGCRCDDSELVIEMERDQKRCQQAFGGVELEKRPGVERLLVRLSQANLASADRKNCTSTTERV